MSEDLKYAAFINGTVPVADFVGADLAGDVVNMKNHTDAYFIYYFGGRHNRGQQPCTCRVAIP